MSTQLNHKSSEQHHVGESLSIRFKESVVWLKVIVWLDYTKNKYAITWADIRTEQTRAVHWSNSYFDVILFLW